MDIITPLHTSTSRNYLARMQDAKVACMQVALLYGAEYWDGDRCYGYGGFRYDGRWRPVAEKLVEPVSTRLATPATRMMKTLLCW